MDEPQSDARAQRAVIGGACYDYYRGTSAHPAHSWKNRCAKNLEAAAAGNPPQLMLNQGSLFSIRALINLQIENERK